MTLNIATFLLRKYKNLYHTEKPTTLA